MSAVSIRAMTLADRPFVAKSWRESWFAEHASGPLIKSAYDGAYNATIDAILDAPTTKTLVAFWPDEAPPLDILGFAVVERRAHRHDRRTQCALPIVHFVYTRHDPHDPAASYRGRGIATRLLREAEVTLERKAPTGPDTFCATFKSRAGMALVKEKWTGGRFDPLIVRFMHQTKERTP